MINNRGTLFEVSNMSRTKRTPDFWEEIIDSLVLEIEPPVRYIKDAIIITKDGDRFKLSPDAFAALLEKEKAIPPEQSEIQQCSLSIDFPRIKKDMNKWATDLIDGIEGSFKRPKKKTISKLPKKSTNKIISKTSTKTKRKID